MRQARRKSSFESQKCVRRATKVLLKLKNTSGKQRKCFEGQNRVRASNESSFEVQNRVGEGIARPRKGQNCVREALRTRAKAKIASGRHFVPAQRLKMRQQSEVRLRRRHRPISRVSTALLGRFRAECERTSLCWRDFGESAGAFCFAGAISWKVRAHFASPARFRAKCGRILLPRHDFGQSACALRFAGAFSGKVRTQKSCHPEGGLTIRVRKSYAFFTGRTYFQNRLGSWKK